MKEDDARETTDTSILKIQAKDGTSLRLSTNTKKYDRKIIVLEKEGVQGLSGIFNTNGITNVNDENNEADDLAKDHPQSTWSPIGHERGSLMDG
ncbi:hypothetical protein V6N11_034178 [Hibiscus sabdariffa]|uniref:Uncharacterized protein n=1 Tax=Hibiscus sabdariffa TaxID=183260 RepID=A0ABR2S1U0_9ROSI